MPHVALIGVAILAPIVYGPEDARSTIQLALVVYPLLVLTASLIAYLRQRLVADHRSYRLFAEETLALADRIAGYSLSAQQPAPVEVRDGLPDWSRYRVSARASTAAAAILALPLVTAGLAAAGVKLPGFADRTFGNVGIDLPNQSDGIEAVIIERQESSDGSEARPGGPEGKAMRRTATPSASTSPEVQEAKMTLAARPHQSLQPGPLWTLQTARQRRDLQYLRSTKLPAAWDSAGAGTKPVHPARYSRTQRTD